MLIHFESGHFYSIVSNNKYSTLFMSPDEWRPLRPIDVFRVLLKTNVRFYFLLENFTLDFMSESYAISLVSPYVACGFLFGGRVHGWYIARVRHDNNQETRVARTTKSSTFQLGHVLASAIVLYADDDNKRSITGVTHLLVAVIKVQK